MRKILFLTAVFVAAIFGVAYIAGRQGSPSPHSQAPTYKEPLILVSGFTTGGLDVSRDERKALLAGQSELGELVITKEADPRVGAEAKILEPEELYAYLNKNPRAIGAILASQADARVSVVTEEGINPLAKDAVSIMAVGDMMLSRYVHTKIVQQNDWSWPFREVAAKLSSYDLTFGNLETSVSGRFDPAKTRFTTTFVSSPRTTEGMKLAGFDALSLANNHASNFGMAAFTDTLDILKGAGIEYFGGGGSEAAARAGTDLTIKDLDLSLLGYNTITGTIEAGAKKPGVLYIRAAPFFPFDQTALERAAADVKTKKESGRFVIVYLHWGKEFTHQANDDQRRIAHGLIDAGADLVIGTHAHWVQGAEFYRGKLIVYGLGNFVFDQALSDKTRQGIALEGLIRDGRLVSARFIPVHIHHRSQPAFLDPSGAEAQQVLTDVYSHSFSEEFK